MIFTKWKSFTSMTVELRVQDGSFLYLTVIVDGEKTVIHDGSTNLEGLNYISQCHTQLKPTLCGMIR